MVKSRFKGNTARDSDNVITQIVTSVGDAVTEDYYIYKLILIHGYCGWFVYECARLNLIINTPVQLYSHHVLLSMIMRPIIQNHTVIHRSIIHRPLQEWSELSHKAILYCYNREAVKLSDIGQFLNHLR